MRHHRVKSKLKPDNWKVNKQRASQFTCLNTECYTPSLCLGPTEVFDPTHMHRDMKWYAAVARHCYGPYETRQEAHDTVMGLLANAFGHNQADIKTILDGFMDKTVENIAGGKPVDLVSCRKCKAISHVIDELVSPYTGLCRACSGSNQVQ